MENQDNYDHEDNHFASEDQQISQQDDSLNEFQRKLSHIKGLLRTDGNPLNFKTALQEFVDESRLLCIKFIAASDFKPTYVIYKQVDRILRNVLLELQAYDDEPFPIKAIMNSLSPSDNYQSPENVNITKILKQSSDLIVKKLNSKFLQTYAFCASTLDSLIESINNQGTIYMLRGRIEVAIGFLIRAIEGRYRFVNSHAHQYQIAIICLNMAICYKTLNQIESAGKLMLKSIMIMENLEKVSSDMPSNSSYAETMKSFISLLEMLFNQSEKDFVASEITPVQRLVYALSSSYKYYAEILGRMNKTEEADYCKQQSASLMNQFKKLNFKQMSKRNSANSSFNKSLSSNNRESFSANNSNRSSIKNQLGVQSQENFSQASFQTINSTSKSNVAFGGIIISKDDIIFQKYVQIIQTYNTIILRFQQSCFFYAYFPTRTVNEVRYKIIFLQIQDHNCVQIILYSKPINFFKKIIVGFASLVEYSKRLEIPNAFSSKEQLNQFFTEVTKRVYLENKRMMIRDLEHYNTIEEFNKFSNILPKGITITQNKS